MTQRGLTVTVPITLKNARDFAAGEFTLAYDAEKMLAHDASLPSLTEAFISASNTQQPGLLQVSLAGMEAIDGDGAILELEFTLTDESEISSIQFGSVRLYDDMGRDFETSALQREILLVPYEEQLNR